MSTVPFYKSPESNSSALNRLYQKSIPNINQIYENPLAYTTWKAYEQEDLFVDMNFFNNVWSMCTKDVLMIDFDFKLDITREDTIRFVREYTDYMHDLGYDFLFQMYDTDRGVHAFLVSHRVSHLTKDALTIMIDLQNDDDYIAFTRIRGYCIRLSAKVLQKTNPGDTIQDIVDREFIAKPMLEPYFRIGYGDPDPYIENILYVHLELINWFVDQYRERLEELTEKRYIPEVDRIDIIPPEYFLQEVANEVIALLEETGLKKPSKKYELTFVPYLRQYPYHNLRIYTQNNINMEYNLYNGIWAICTPYLLMVDFDEKPATEYDNGFTKLDAIKMIQAFTEDNHKLGFDYLFNIYTTDRGIHAFLVNQFAGYQSNKSKYILDKLCNDYCYKDFVKIGTFCTRVGPKMFIEGKLLSKKEITKEFVSKKCFEKFCTIGYGESMLWSEKILYLHETMTEFIKELYRTNYENMTNKRYYYQINDYAHGPSEKIIDLVRNKFIDNLENLLIGRNDMTYNDIWKQQPERYKDLIEDKMYNKCNENTVQSVRDNALRFTKPVIDRACDYTVLGAYGPDVPFVFFREEKNSLFIMGTYDIMMLDFDVKDGVPKKNVINILERFINSQRLIPENLRLTKSELCFKLYETDNGVHAWPISHFFPFYSDQAIKMVLGTCSDIFYATFFSITGYTIRMSPKIYTSALADALLTQEDVDRQFVQKEGLYGVKYVGNTDHINPYIEELVDIIFQTQQYILSIPDSVDKIKTNDDNFLIEVSDYAIKLYKNMKNKRNNYYASRWAKNPYNCVENRIRYN